MTTDKPSTIDCDGNQLTAALRKVHELGGVPIRLDVTGQATYRIVISWPKPRQEELPIQSE